MDNIINKKYENNKTDNLQNSDEYKHFVKSITNYKKIDKITT